MGTNCRKVFTCRLRGVGVAYPGGRGERAAGTCTPSAPATGLPRLLEIADYVLDNAGRLGGASLDHPGLAEAMAPTSTIAGAALIHAAWAGAAEKLVAAGNVPEVWGSANRAPSIPDARRS
jgi:uncharacterized phosphosugar-binding protein